MRFIYHFNVEGVMSFEEYSKQENNFLHKNIIKILWHRNVNTFVSDSIFSLTTYFKRELIESHSINLDYMDEHKQFSYLFFILFCSEEPVEFSLTLFDLCRAENINVYFHNGGLEERFYDEQYYIQSKHLQRFKDALLEKEDVKYVYESIISKYKKKDSYKMMVKDLKNLSEMGNEFLNSSISLEIRNGEPFYMNATTTTNEIDLNKRKEKLGENRKIEENTTKGNIKSLKLTKKIKY